MDGRTPSPPGAGRKYWEWCGKVQERGRCATDILSAMPRRTRLLQYVIVAAMAAPRPGHPQAHFTPLDSAILAPQPLKRLVLSPSLFRRLSVLAAGLDREVVLCLQGTASGDSAMVRDFVMPDLLSSAADAVQPLPCAPATLAVWHNHPWTGPDSSFGVKTPEDFCSLSEPDLRTVIADSVPFAVVSVGRARRPILCWWRRVQAAVDRHVKFLPRFPRQWLRGSGHAGLRTVAPFKASFPPPARKSGGVRPGA